jgi:hypothetical protein
MKCFWWADRRCRGSDCDNDTRAQDTLQIIITFNILLKIGDKGQKKRPLRGIYLKLKKMKYGRSFFPLGSRTDDIQPEK